MIFYNFPLGFVVCDQYRIDIRIQEDSTVKIPVPCDTYLVKQGDTTLFGRQTLVPVENASEIDSNTFPVAILKHDSIFLEGDDFYEPLPWEFLDQNNNEIY